MTTQETERGGAQAQAPAVLRAVRILEALARNPGQVRPLADIARELGIAKSSTSALCAALEQGGLIRRAEGGYLLGRRTVELGSAYLAGFDVIREFYRICEESPVLRHHLVQIAMLDGVRVLYLAVHEGRERFPLSASVGDRYPASATAVGLALLAELDPAEVEARYRDPGHLVAFTGRSVTDPGSLQRALAATRERGHAEDDGGLHVSVVGLAQTVPAPAPGSPTFAVGVSLVHPADTAEERERVLAALAAACDALSRPVLVSAEPGADV